MMTTARAAALVAAAFLLAGCGLGGPAHGPAAESAAAAVTMGFESYDPATVTVRAGDTVEWQNTSLITHTVTDDPKRARSPGDASLPPGAQPFSSGDIAAGQVYFHTFTTPGTYKFICTIHPTEMHLTVTVKK